MLVENPEVEGTFTLDLSETRAGGGLCGGLNGCKGHAEVGGGKECTSSTSSTPPQTGLQKNMGIYSKKGRFNLWREFP